MILRHLIDLSFEKAFRRELMVSKTFFAVLCYLYDIGWSFILSLLTILELFSATSLEPWIGCKNSGRVTGSFSKKQWEELLHSVI